VKSPNITPAQIGSLLTFAIGQAVAFGWLSSSSSQLVVSIGATAIAATWKIADAVIRHGRSRAAAAQSIAALSIEQQTRTSS
jgi:hypothetical protein